MLFSCPKCNGILSKKETSYVCQSGHSFDIARAGYINLLPLSGAKTHGDNKEMVAARRDFLNTGHYLPLAERISELARIHFKKNARVLDVGCGEGYYTAKVEQTLFERDGRTSVSALIFQRMPSVRRQRLAREFHSLWQAPITSLRKTARLMRW